jgi:hypothetical protein
MKSPRLLLVRLMCSLALVGLVGAVPRLHAAGDDDFDSYAIKITAAWFYSNPSGTLQSAIGGGLIDLKKDIGFNSYSTFAGKLDWKFTRKNHLYLLAIPFTTSRQTVLTRTITFQGQTFDAGLATQSELKATLYAPGYQYDILRRRRGHLGIAIQIDAFDSRASFNAAAQVTGDGVRHMALSASASRLLPLPIVGPEFRFYLTNSPRLYVQGNVYGMYFFGYGNFVSSAGTLGVRVAKHLDVIAGYQLGSRLNAHNSSSNNRIGISLTQTGAVVGVEVPFGGTGQ